MASLSDIAGTADGRTGAPQENTMSHPDTEHQLTATLHRLTVTETELAATKTELAAMKDQLVTTEKKLENTRDEFAAMKVETAAQNPRCQAPKSFLDLSGGLWSSTSPSWELHPFVLGSKTDDCL